MDIQLNFDKKTISIRLYKFLAENMKEEGERRSIMRLMNKKKLAYQDANQLIQGLLSAMVMEEAGAEEEEEEEFVIAPESDGNLDSQSTSQVQSGSGTSDPPSQTQTQQNGTQIEKPDFSQVCKHYRNGDCKFGAKCRQEHPKFCKKFVKHGLIRHNQSGCDSKCGRLHPNACRNSLRMRECDREKCRFFHIKGTINTFTPTQSGGWSEREKERWREETRREETRREEGYNRGEKVKTSDQVFLESQQTMVKMLAMLSEKMEAQMEEMKGWAQKQTQERQNYRPRTDPPQWRQPQGVNHWASQ